MDIEYKALDAAKHKTPALVVFIFSDDKSQLKQRPELAWLQKYIGPRLKAKDFKGDYLAVLPLFVDMPKGPECILLVGLGAKKKIKPQMLRTAGAKAAQNLESLGVKRAAVLLPPAFENSGGVETILEKTAMGLHLGLYKYEELKTKNKTKSGKLAKVTLIGSEKQPSKKTGLALKWARVTAEQICWTRNLVNRPANLLKPENLAAEARKLVKNENIKIKVMGLSEAGRRKMGAFLAVNQGSDAPGRIIILEYNGAEKKKKPLALVGKAITFDSGGYNLKPGTGMKNMKTDMAGGAAIISVVAAAARLGIKDNIVAIVPVTENMVSGASYRPGDVVTTMSGLNVEITNTDAEGRLILADGITLIQQYKPRAIIDMATLTGACSVALGDKLAGVMGTSENLVEKLKQAGEKSGDLVWELPLFEDYFDSLKSQTGDFNNAGARGAGAIVAGLFLKQFVNNIPWAHLDIAGTGRAEKGSPDISAGGTGFGVALLIELLRS